MKIHVLARDSFNDDNEFGQDPSSFCGNGVCDDSREGLPFWKLGSMEGGSGFSSEVLDLPLL